MMTQVRPLQRSPSMFTTSTNCTSKARGHEPRCYSSTCLLSFPPSPLNCRRVKSSPWGAHMTCSPLSSAGKMLGGPFPESFSLKPSDFDAALLSHSVPTLLQLCTFHVSAVTLLLSFCACVSRYLPHPSSLPLSSVCLSRLPAAHMATH